MLLKNSLKEYKLLINNKSEKIFLNFFVFLFADLSYTYKLTTVIIKFYRRNFIMEQNELKLQTADDNENPFAISDLNIFGTDSLFAAKRKNKDEDDDYDDDEEDEKDDYYDDDEEDEDDLFEDEPKKKEEI